MLPKGLRVAVSGFGLIGGSIALRARSQGAHVTAWDTNPAVLAGVGARGIASAARSFATLASACDVLVLAAPLDATLDQLADLEHGYSDAALVIDVASVKATPAFAGRRVPHFVPTHPIAGSERSGFAAARRDLFEGRVWTYEPAASPADIERAVGFIAAMGARPLAVSSTEHDRVVALTSHLPQLLSVLLATQLARRLEAAAGPDEADISALCGTGMASMLRLANSAWHVWEPILTANAGPIAQEVRKLAAILLDAASALETGGVASLEDRFAAAKSAVARLEANESIGSRVAHANDASAPRQSEGPHDHH